MTDEDISQALDAIKAAVRDLVSLTASDEAEQLLLEADALRVRVESWRDTPPAAVEREEVLGRVVRLREAAATCAQAPFTRSPSAPAPSGVHASAAVNVPRRGPVPSAVGPIETVSFVLPEKPAVATAPSTVATSSTADLGAPNAAVEAVGERPLPVPVGRQTRRNLRAALIVGAALVAMLVWGLGGARVGHLATRWPARRRSRRPKRPSRPTHSDLGGGSLLATARCVARRHPRCGCRNGRFEPTFRPRSRAGRSGRCPLEPCRLQDPKRALCPRQARLRSGRRRLIGERSASVRRYALGGVRRSAPW